MFEGLEYVAQVFEQCMAHSTAQHSTAQHSAAQRSAAQLSRAEHLGEAQQKLELAVKASKALAGRKLREVLEEEVTCAPGLQHVGLFL